MQNPTEPYSKQELIDAFKQINEKVTESFNSIPAERFFQQNAENWSAAENLVHVIKSVSPVSKAIKLPEMLAAGVFRAAQRPSQSYREIADRYMAQVHNGLQTTPPFAPAVDATPPDAEQEKLAAITKWQEVSTRLLTALNDWTEADLDQHMLPHPILGDLTVREMLFFTLIHNMLHANEARVFMGERTLAL